jgi:tetratricopeptide (TPR) repeat protein
MALATLYARQALLLYMHGRLREDLASAEHAERVARLVDDRVHLGEALHLRGTALLRLGSVRAAVQTLSEAIAVNEEAGYHYMLGMALWVIADAHYDLGAFATARHATERALTLAERHGFRMVETLATTRRGWIAFASGAWAAARRDFERGVVIGREMGRFWASVFAPLGLGALSLAEGLDAEATRHLEQCEGQLHAGEQASLGLKVVGQRVVVVLAERDLLAGRPEMARTRLAPLLDPDARQEEDVTPVLPLMAWALLDVGEVSEAADLVSRAVIQAREEDKRVLLIDALRVAAMIAARQGRWGEAEIALADGLSHARRLGYPYGEARLLQVHGEVLAQTDQPMPAQEQLEAALAIFRQLGARRDAAHVEQAVAALLSRVESVPDPPSLPVDHAPIGTRPARADRQAWALERLRTTGALSPGAYASALGVSVDTALRDLQQLVYQGLVQAAGKTKNRRYTLAGDTAGPAIRRTGL